MGKRNILLSVGVLAALMGCQKSAIDASDSAYTQVNVEVYAVAPERNIPPMVVPPPPPLLIQPVHRDAMHPPRAPPTDCLFKLPPSRPLPRPPMDVSELSNEEFDSLLEQYITELINHDRNYKTAVESEFKRFQKRCR